MSTEGGREAEYQKRLRAHDLGRRVQPRTDTRKEESKEPQRSPAGPGDEGGRQGLVPPSPLFLFLLSPPSSPSPPPPSPALGPGPRLFLAGAEFSYSLGNSLPAPGNALLAFRRSLVVTGPAKGERGGPVTTISLQSAWAPTGEIKDQIRPPTEVVPPSTAPALLLFKASRATESQGSRKQLSARVLCPDLRIHHGYGK